MVHQELPPITDVYFVCAWGSLNKQTNKQSKKGPSRNKSGKTLAHLSNREDYATAEVVRDGSGAPWYSQLELRAAVPVPVSY